jgi:Domain of unknown function (DUF5916)
MVPQWPRSVCQLSIARTRTWFSRVVEAHDAPRYHRAGRNFDNNINRTWDGLLTSKGQVTDTGYTIEAAIPFTTLSYGGGTTPRWGLHVQRWIARKAENISWRPVSREASSLLTQMGSLVGLQDIGGGPKIDAIPSLTSALTSQRGPVGGLAHATDLDPGITVNWAVTPNTTVIVAANPDFSQIEADVPQIEVNQRFPLTYPEKRPFFLEGDQYFRSPGALGFLTSRQIVDPDWGAKLTTKTGRNTLAIMMAGGRRAGCARRFEHTWQRRGCLLRHRSIPARHPPKLNGRRILLDTEVCWR